MALVLFTSGRKLLTQRRKDVHDEDFVQRLFGNYFITIVLVLAIICTPGQYFGSSISCWNDLGGVRKSFYERQCLIKGTYRVPEGKHPENYRPPVNAMVWYPFTPLIVILQITPFLFISMIWKSCNRMSGIEISAATEAAKEIESVSKLGSNKKMENALDYISNNLHKMCKGSLPAYNDSLHIKAGRVSRLRRSFTHCCSVQSRSYLTTMLMLVKAMNIAAIFLNVSALSYILGSEYALIGIRFFFRLSLGRPLLFEEMFPIMVMCRQEIAVNLNNKRVFKHPCILNLNMFNEKVFIFLWFLYATLLIVALVDLIQNICFFCSPRYKYEFFSSYFPISKTASQISNKKRFFLKYASNDACTVLKIMAGHLDNLTMSILCTKIYDLYLNELTKMEANKNLDADGDDELSFSEADEFDNKIDDFANLAPNDASYVIEKPDKPLLINMDS